MRTLNMEKKKGSLRRAVEDVVFSIEMSTMDCEPSREEETFLQLIWLDRFITKVQWEILHIQVVQEVITNFNTDIWKQRSMDELYQS